MNVYDSVFMNSRKLNKEQFIYLFSIYLLLTIKIILLTFQLLTKTNYLPCIQSCFQTSWKYFCFVSVYRSTWGCMFLWELLSKCCAVKSMDLSIMLRGQIIDHVFAWRFPVYCACAVHAKERETKSQFHRKKYTKTKSKNEQFEIESNISNSFGLKEEFQ